MARNAKAGYDVLEWWSRIKAGIAPIGSNPTRLAKQLCGNIPLTLYPLSLDRPATSSQRFQCGSPVFLTFCSVGLSLFAIVQNVNPFRICCFAGTTGYNHVTSSQCLKGMGGSQEVFVTMILFVLLHLNEFLLTI